MFDGLEKRKGESWIIDQLYMCVQLIVQECKMKKIKNKRGIKSNFSDS